jgi:hypothetical protein
VIKSVNGIYADDIQYRTNPRLTVEYTLTRQQRNGVDVESGMQACISGMPAFIGLFRFFAGLFLGLF